MNLIKRLKNIIEISYSIKSIKNIKEIDAPKTILINTTRPILYPLTLERILGYFLARSGHKVIQLLDDGVLAHWDSSTKNQKNALSDYRNNSLYALYNKFIISILIFFTNHKNLKIIKLSSFQKSHDDYEVQNMSHILSSCRRYTSDKLFWKNLKEQDYYKKCYENASLWENISKDILLQLNPEILISSHGVYTNWGYLHDCAMDLNIKTYVFSKCPYKSNSVFISKNAFQKINHDRNDFEKDILKDCQIKDVEEFYKNRLNKSSPDSSIFYDNSFSDIISVVGKISRNNNTTFSMFPNVIWDGAIEERNIIFNSILDWVIESIIAISTSENNLLIRFHPSEVSMFSGSESFEELIAERLPEYKNFKNIHIISSDKNIDSYELIQNFTDITLVYDGLVALESSYLGVPCITSAQARYGSANFSYLPKNKNDYIEILQDKNSKKRFHNYIDDKRKLSLYNFTYWYTNSIVFEFPLINFTDNIDNISNKDIYYLKNYNPADLIKKLS